MRIQTGDERFPCTPCGPCERRCPRLGAKLERLRPALVGAIGGGLHPGLRRRVDPEDIVQDAFIEVLRRAPRYLANPSMPFEAWVRWITWDKRHQVHRRHLAAGKRDLRRVVPLDGGDPAPLAADCAAWRQDTALADPRESPLRILVRLEEHRRVCRAIDALSGADREILRARLVEDASNQEAARQLGLGISAASHRFHRALHRLRRAISPAGWGRTWRDARKRATPGGF